MLFVLWSTQETSHTSYLFLRIVVFQCFCFPEKESTKSCFPCSLRYLVLSGFNSRPGSQWPGQQSLSGSWCPEGVSCLLAICQRRTSADVPLRCPPGPAAASSASLQHQPCWHWDVRLCLSRGAPWAGTPFWGLFVRLCFLAQIPLRSSQWLDWQVVPSSRQVAGSDCQAHHSTRSGILKRKDGNWNLYCPKYANIFTDHRYGTGWTQTS